GFCRPVFDPPPPGDLCLLRDELGNGIGSGVRMASLYDVGAEPVAGFRLNRLLGHGPHSRVWRATAPRGTEVALQVIRLGTRQTLKELKALRLCRRIRHPNLVPLIAFWVKDGQGNLLGEECFDEVPLGSRKDLELVIAMGLGDESLADRLRTCQEQGQPGVPATELLRLLADAA